MSNKELVLNGLKIKISFSESTLTKNLISECNKSFIQILNFKLYRITNKYKENIMTILEKNIGRCIIQICNKIKRALLVCR